MKKNIKINLKNFCNLIDKNILKRFEIYKSSRRKLIGKTVISIRSGFSTVGGGQIMKIDSIKDDIINLIPTEKSLDIYDDEFAGWAVAWEDRYNSFILYE